MKQRLESPQGYALEVQPQPQGCAWFVSDSEGLAISGQAPDRHSAQRRATLAVETLQALERISRRSF
ncbi:MAG: hypothetical protein P4L64_08140 [Caulobacteraceae bacterium]|nr:hypothetical protein [Caulobacteraceae bacterium]